MAMYPGATWGVHQISADSEGNLYAAEVFGGRTQKFVPKPNANPHDLFFGRELAPKTPVTRISTVSMAIAATAASVQSQIQTRRFPTLREPGISTSRRVRWRRAEAWETEWRSRLSR